MIVQSHDTWGETAEFDPRTGELRGVTSYATATERDRAGVAFDGLYTRKIGRLTLLYREGGGLVLWLAGRPWPATAETVRWSKRLGLATLSVDGGPGIRYMPTGRIPFDLTPFVEDEDFDFGLYVHNVLADPARASRIFGV
ncbi:hypothetical protein AB0I28_01050 [Phytomonospora sp. NPDC050363]|uniref:hypothetical protein n=1 Tax=Phytomonospora sp. NPDC050363 TaxID=3155642 RepID=UPI0033F4BB26